MQEKTLLRIALITSITGICLLFIISSYWSDYEKPFQLMKQDDYGVVTGEIARVSQAGNMTIISIYQNRPLTAVIAEDYIGLKKGDYVEVRGTVQKYNGQKELFVDEMRKP